MTEKRFSIKAGSIIGLSSIYTDNGKVMTQLEVLDVLIKQHETIQILTKENEQLTSKHYWYKQYKELLNENEELNTENQQLRKFIMDLQNMIQFDVDNGIKTYPKTLSEYLANVLKVMLND